MVCCVGLLYSEWYPNKIGLSIGYRIFNPHKKK